MKVSKETVELNRERVIDAAAILLREKGIDGTGIAELMSAAGLTHGGFYRQFKSKDDLVVQAIQRAYATMSDDLRGRIESAAESPLKTLVRYYVSEHHRDDPGQGCSLAALASDAARSNDPALRSFFEHIVTNYIELMSTLVAGRNRKAKRAAAISALAEMVGAIVLSRVMSDPTQSREILTTVSDDVIARHSSTA